MGKVLKIFESQPYLVGHVTLTEKKAYNSKGIQFWLLKTVPAFNDHQDTKRDFPLSFRDFSF